MNRFIRWFLWSFGIVVIIGFFLGSFIWKVLLIPAVLLTLILAIGIFNSYKKKRSKSGSEIPDDVLEDFEQAEKMFKDHNGKMTHQQVLWTIAKQKIQMSERRNVNNGREISESSGSESRSRDNRDSRETYSRTRVQPLPRSSLGRYQVPSDDYRADDSRIPEDRSEVRSANGNNRKSLFGKRR